MSRTSRTSAADSNIFSRPKADTPAADRASIAAAWKSGVQFVKDDEDFSKENESLFKLSSTQSPEKVQQSIKDLLDDYEANARLSKVMKHVRPLVEGLQKVESVGSSIAAFDPHGIAPVVWGSAQLVLSGIHKYHESFDKIESFVAQMNGEIDRLRLWEKPAKSEIFAASLRAVFRKYAQFCIAVTSYLKSKWQGNIFKSSGRVKHLIEEIQFECTNATKNAEAASANNVSITLEKQTTTLDDLQQDFNGVRIGIGTLQTGMNSVSDDIGALREGLDLKTHGEFLSWIGFYDTTYILNRANTDRLAGTGAWIYDDGDDSVVKKWLSSQPNDHQILWMTADPGFGKTCLTARIVKELGEFDPRGVAWFFCSAYDNNTHSVQAILQSWIHQLLRTKTGVAHFASPLCFEGFINQEPISVQSLCDVIRELFVQDKPTRLIVDGLDECRVDKKVAEDDFEAFFELLAELPNNWRVMMVSRNNPYFKPWLEAKLADVVKCKEISPKDTKDDLASFVQDQMMEYGTTKGWDEQFYAAVTRTIEDRAKGMFMWIKLVAKQIKDEAKDAEEDILKVVMSQPDLGDIYKTELRALINKPRIFNDEYVDPLIKTLRWAVCTFRPLKIQELEAAFGRSGVLVERVEKHLGSFLRIIRPSWEVQVVHETAGAFILEQASSMPLYVNRFKHVDQRGTHGEIALACLRVLSTTGPDKRGKALTTTHQPSNDPDRQLQLFYDRFRDAIGWFPGERFLHYAANYWQYHFERCTPNEELCEVLTRFCSSDICTVRWLMLLFKSQYSDAEFRKIGGMLSDKHRPAYDRWRNRILDQPGGRLPRLQRYWNHQLHEFPPAIHVAAWFNYSQIITNCLRRGYSVDDLDHGKTGPLRCAAIGECQDAANVLILAGIDVNATGWDGFTALTWSILRGPGPDPEYRANSFGVAKLLLRAGADPNCVSRNRWNPWKAVNQLSDSQPQVRELKEVLKKRGAVPLEGWKYEVEEAAKFTDLKRMQRALEKDMNPNVICDRGATRLNRTIFEAPLHAALSPYNRNPEIVKMLLKKGASVNIRQADGRTPLHLAVRKNDGCTKLLLDRGADMTAQADDGSTPAHDVCRQPQAHTFEAFDILLKHNTACHGIKDFWGRTPFDIACQYYGNGAEPPKYIAADGKSTFYKSPQLDSYPKTTGQVLNVFAHLEIAFKYRAPRTLILRIINSARYWLCGSSSRCELVRINEQKWKTEYLRSPPLKICYASNLMELRFSVVSRDQGFSIFPFQHGSYEKANSWCDWWANRATGQEIDRKGDTPFLFDNVHGDPRPREYIVSFGRHPPETRTPIALPAFDFYRVPPWIDGVQNGDTYWLGMGAHAQGWECWIFSAKIEVFTSPLLPVVKQLIWRPEYRSLSLHNASAGTAA